MRSLMIIVMATMLAGCATTYRRPILGMFGGYGDRQIGEGAWKVKFGTNGYTPRGYALKAAIYRSAELAQRAGYPYFQIVESNLTRNVMVMGNTPPEYGSFIGEGVHLTIRGARTEDAELKCENANGRGCMTLSTEEALRELGPVVRPSRAAEAQTAQSP